jgi:hypothetical protein
LITVQEVVILAIIECVNDFDCAKIFGKPKLQK